MGSAATAAARRCSGTPRVTPGSPREPWLPLAADYKRRNVAVERGDPRSLYTLHCRLLALRRRRPALQQGSYRPLIASADVLIYGREFEGDRIIVALNLGAASGNVGLPNMGGAEILLSTAADREGERPGGTVRLHANEGVVNNRSPSSHGTNGASSAITTSAAMLLYLFDFGAFAHDAADIRRVYHSVDRINSFMQIPESNVVIARI